MPKDGKCINLVIHSCYLKSGKLLVKREVWLRSRYGRGWLCFVSQAFPEPQVTSKSDHVFFMRKPEL